MHQTSSFGLDFIKHTAVWKICCMQYLVQILQYVYCHKNLMKKNTDIATDESSLKVLELFIEGRKGHLILTKWQANPLSSLTRVRVFLFSLFFFSLSFLFSLSLFFSLSLMFLLADKIFDMRYWYTSRVYYLDFRFVWIIFLQLLPHKWRHNIQDKAQTILVFQYFFCKQFVNFSWQQLSPNNTIILLPISL